ncbi:MAG: hypothetical protein HYX41_01020 [Bdellovibrio sp.]|nr:hypothetical protein [Bdellovibrio sp.]
MAVQRLKAVGIFFLAFFLLEGRPAFAELFDIYFDTFKVLYDTATNEASVTTLNARPLDIKGVDGEIIQTQKLWRGRVPYDAESINGVPLNDASLLEKGSAQKALRAKTLNLPDFETLLASLISVPDEASRLVILAANLTDKSDLSFSKDIFFIMLDLFASKDYVTDLVLNFDIFNSSEDLQAILERLEKPGSEIGSGKIPVSNETLTQVFGRRYLSKAAQNIHPSFWLRLYRLFQSDLARLEVLDSWPTLPIDPSDAAILFEYLEEDEARLHAISAFADVTFDAYQVEKLLNKMATNEARLIAFNVLIPKVRLTANLSPRFFQRFSSSGVILVEAIRILLAHPDVNSVSAEDALSILALIHENEQTEISSAIQAFAEKIRFNPGQAFEASLKIKDSGLRKAAQNIFHSKETLWKAGDHFLSAIPELLSRHPELTPEVALELLSFARLPETKIQTLRLIGKAISFDPDLAVAISLSFDSNSHKKEAFLGFREGRTPFTEKHVQMILDNMSSDPVKPTTQPKIEKPVRFQQDTLPDPASPPISQVHASGPEFESPLASTDFQFKDSTTKYSLRSNRGGTPMSFSVEKTSVSFSEDGIRTKTKQTSFRFGTPSLPTEKVEVPVGPRSSTVSEALGAISGRIFSSDKLSALKNFRLPEVSIQELERLIKALPFESTKLEGFSHIWSTLSEESRKSIRESRSRVLDLFFSLTVRSTVNLILNQR